jgi:hypothetical protein
MSSVFLNSTACYEIVGILMVHVVTDCSGFSFEKEWFRRRIIHELVVEI